MRKCMVVFIALAVLAAGGAAWADTNTLTVTASVKGTCKFSSPTSTLNFGALDPASPVDVSGSNVPAVLVHEAGWSSRLPAADLGYTAPVRHVK